MYDNYFYEWSKEEIISRINGGVHVMAHEGHADYDYNMKLEISDIDALTNTNPFFAYSTGCYSGGFNDPAGVDCMAEQFTVKTSHGAFAAIMNGAAGWGARWTTDSASQRFIRQFWDAVFGENITIISKANHDSKEDNIWRIDQKYMRYVFYELNLFGDPAVQFKYLDSSLVKIKNQGYQSSQHSTVPLFFRILQRLSFAQ